MRALTLLACLAFPIALQAQSANCRKPVATPVPGGAGEAFGDYARVASLARSDSTDWTIQRPSTGVTIACDGIWELKGDTTAAEQRRLELHPVKLEQIENTGYPKSMHDGLLWAGKGMSGTLSAGATARAGIFTLVLEPVVAYQQNADFVTVTRTRANLSDLAYPWYTTIDWPQRFGTSSYSTVSLGQSVLRADWRMLQAGFSTENLRWGPAMRNPIIMDNNAPGFPHVFWGVHGWRTFAGTIDGEVVWGQQRESKYFDTTATDDKTLFTGVVLAIQPRGLTGLTLGGARVFDRRWSRDSLTFGKLFAFAQTIWAVTLVRENGTQQDNANQLGSVFARYATNGFEVYGEWGRNDHSANLDDFLAEPNHAQAYTLGFQKVIPKAERWYRVRGELTSLGGWNNGSRRVPVWYVHSTIKQGYTNQGQLIGSALGPGGDARYLGFDVFGKRMRNSVYFQHARYDEDAYASRIVKVHTWTAHDVELTAGTENYFRFRSFDVFAGLSYSSRRNRNFRFCDDAHPEIVYCYLPQYRDHNWQIPISLVWYPR